MGAKRSLMALLAFVWTTCVAAQDMRIPFAEKVTIAAVAGQVEFDAYGRRFVLALESNARLLAALPAPQKAGIADAQLLRGRIEGVPGSWVRIARVAGGLEGAIWDGTDLYVVTRHASIAAQLTAPLQAGPSQTVVYRLSDVQGGLSKEFCGLEVGLPASASSPSALKQYESMVADLRTRASTAAATLTDQLDISLVADSEFQARYGTNARDTMLARLNTVDGIFSDQVGVLLAPAAVRLVPASNPFNTTSADELLDDVATYRAGDVELRAAGITHLMTGKDLDGNTAGIAFLNSLCDEHDGASLSDSIDGEFYGALIMAHELGHNFGARHDGVAGTACASTPSVYLMWPSINGSSQFSQCSLNAMRTVIERARASACIKPASYSDVSLSLPASPYAVDTITEFSVPMTVRSAGTIAAAHSHLVINFESQLSFRSATVPGGSCAPSGSVIECDLGSIPAGEQRVVDVRFISLMTGTFNVSGRVSADGDRYSANDVASVQVGLRSPLDLAVAVTASATSFFVNDTVDLIFDVSSLRTATGHGATLAINTSGFVVDGIDSGAHVCAADSVFDRWTCRLADIPGGGSTRIVVRAHSVFAGPRQVSGYVQLANDGNQFNDYGSINLTALAERELRLHASSEDLDVVIGATQQLVYTVTTAGRLPVVAAVFEVSIPEIGAFDSVVPDAGSCTQGATTRQYSCAFGTLNPGDTRRITVRFKTASAGSSVVFAGALFDDAGSLQGVSVTTWIYSNARVDVLALVSGFLRFDEGQSAQGNALVRSVGIDPAQNVVYTIEVPSPAKLTRLALSIAAPGWTCAIVTPQRGRCMGSFEAGAPGATAWLGYVISSDTAMTGNVTGTVTATDDGDATNDSASAQFEVLPALDAGISSSQPNLLIDANETTTVNVTLTTGRNAVPGVVLTVNGTFEVAIEEIRVGGVACTQLTSNLPPGVNPGCQLGDLAANVNLPVAVRYRAGPNEGQGSLYIGTSATRDSNYLNNSVSLPYMVQKQTDIGVATESASISANAGDPLTFPTITVTPADAAAHHVVLRIPLPSFATLGSVSAFNGGICTGTTTLECTFDTIPRGLSGGVQFSLLNASAGTFTSNITMTAGNDTTSANNATSVSVTVTAPTPPSGGGSSSSGGGGSSSSSSSSSGGGKGGGRLEWIGLAFLALLVARRSGRRVEPTRHHSLH